MMTSVPPAWFVSFQSNPLEVPANQVWWHRSYRNGDMDSYINSFMNTLEKADFTALICQIEIFKIKITNLQFWRPRHGWLKNEKKKSDCKVLSVKKCNLLNMTKFISVLSSFRLIQQSLSRTRYQMISLHSALKSLSNET